MENLFYIIVTVVALIILIILLVVFGYTMSKGVKSGVFPPLANACPDFWVNDPSNNNLCIVPNYVGANVGTFVPSSSTTDTNLYGLVNENGTYKINFSDPKWGTNSGTSAICAKQNWVGLHGISWDGVGNYNGRC